MPLTIVPARLVLFTFTARSPWTPGDLRPVRVLAQAWQDVSAAFAFGQRALGQGVAASEIIEVIQRRAGRTGGPADRLAAQRQPATAGPVLQASGPCRPARRSRRSGAELLLLDPATQGQLGSWS